MNKSAIVTVVFLLLTFHVSAQEKPKTMEEVIQLAIENNSGLKASALQIEEADALVGSAFSFDKTDVYYKYENNANEIEPLKVFGISQDFKFPTVYLADKKVNQAQLRLQESAHAIGLQNLKREVYSAYYNLSYAKNKAKSYRFLDSLYQNFAHSAKRRFELGETNYLEMITSQSKHKQLETFYKQAQQEVIMYQSLLKKIVQVEDLIVADEPLKKLAMHSESINENVGMLYFEQSKSVYAAKTHQEKQRLMPDISLEYLNGIDGGLNEDFVGYQVGLKIPLLFGGNSSKIKASKIAQEIVEEQKQDYQTKWQAEKEVLFAKLQQYDEAVIYYETQGKHLSEEIIKTAERTLKEGEIDFFQYIQSIEASKDIEMTYLNNLNAYNQTIIAINYLILN